MGSLKLEIINHCTEEIFHNMKTLRQLKQDTPRLKVAVTLEPGSILNGYREGDIDFNEAVKMIKDYACNYADEVSSSMK